MEASTLQAPVALSRLSISAPLLRLRSDEQLVDMFRAGSEEAFRAIHDRYRARLLAYARQMLGGSRQDAEDVLQDVFVRVYGALRTSQRPISLRAWLYRIAHNRCIDQLRRPVASAAELFDVSRAPVQDPPVQTERREQLRRLVIDVGRLPDQQRSALLMRELQGMSYDEMSEALDVSVAAIKSLLVRARGGLVGAAEARDAACAEVRCDLALACDRGVRVSGVARRHLWDCAGCRDYRDELRGVHRRIAALVPVGPLGVLAQALGFGGSGAAVSGSAAAAGSGASAGGIGAIVTVTKVAIVAAAVTAGGLAVAHKATAPAHHPGTRRSAAAGALGASATLAAPHGSIGAVAKRLSVEASRQRSASGGRLAGSTTSTPSGGQSVSLALALAETGGTLGPAGDSIGPAVNRVISDVAGVLGSTPTIATATQGLTSAGSALTGATGASGSSSTSSSTGTTADGSGSAASSTSGSSTTGSSSGSASSDTAGSSTAASGSGSGSSSTTSSGSSTSSSGSSSTSSGSGSSATTASDDSTASSSGQTAGSGSGSTS